MLIKQSFLICMLSVLLVGCSFYGSQPPAPVYGNGATVYNKKTPVLPKPPKPKEVGIEDKSQGSSETFKAQPLKENVSIAAITEELQPEPLTPEQEKQVQESLLLEQGDVTAEPGLVSPNPEQATSVQGMQPVIIAPKQELMTSQAPSFKPLDIFPPLSPAVGALVLAASQNTKAGNIESATTTIERAIRIEPRNATLYYKLALLRLRQSKPVMAEDLAKKAVLLASNDTQMKKHSWLLIARAREMQGDLNGGKEARSKADKF
jgi:tetratricopeptide (TPR) repeat protein